MGKIEDENRFDFYVGEAIEELRNNEDWSDSKIALWLRKKAHELNPLRKTKKLTIPKEFVEDLLKKELSKR